MPRDNLTNRCRNCTRPLTREEVGSDYVTCQKCRDYLQEVPISEP